MYVAGIFPYYPSICEMHTVITSLGQHTDHKLYVGPWEKYSCTYVPRATELFNINLNLRHVPKTVKI